MGLEVSSKNEARGLQKNEARGLQKNEARGLQKNEARGLQKNEARVSPYTTPLLPKHAKFDLNFTPIAIFCGYAARFVSDLVGNSERRSHDAAQIIIKPLNVLLLKMFYYSIVSSH